jgi:hypothetical protein
MDFPKIAFRADAQIALGRIIQMAEDAKCNEVYLICDNPDWLSGLRKVEITVHQVATRDELPADVFYWRAHEGFWAAVGIDDGMIRDIGWASDSLMATVLLLNRFSEAYRKHFRVEPVDVKVIEEG